MNIKDLYKIFLREKVQKDFVNNNGLCTTVLCDAIICNHYIVLYEIDDTNSKLESIFWGI